MSSLLIVDQSGGAGRSTLLASGHRGFKIQSLCALNATSVAVSEMFSTVVHVKDLNLGKTVMSGRFNSPVLSMDVLASATAAVLVVGLDDGSVHVAELVTSLPALCALRVDQSQARGVTCVRFSPSGKFIAAGIANGSVVLLAVEDDSFAREAFSKLRKVAVCNGHGGKVTGMDFSTDGQILRSESQEGRDLFFWSGSDGSTIKANRANDVNWQSSTCTFGWKCKALHRHVAAPNPVMLRHIAPVVGHRVRTCAGPQNKLKATGSKASSRIGRVVEVSEEGWYMVAWEGGEVEMADEESELVYPGEDLVAVDGSGSLLVGCGNGGSLIVLEHTSNCDRIFHCSTQSGPANGVSFLPGGDSIVSAGASCLLHWGCKRRQRRRQGLYFDLERVLRDSAGGSMSAMLVALVEFATRYFGMDSIAPPAETKAKFLQLVFLFRKICGARTLHPKTAEIPEQEPRSAPSKFVGRSPIRRTFHQFTKHKSTREPSPSTQKTRVPLRHSNSAHDKSAAAAVCSPSLDREARLARFRSAIFSPFSHGRGEGTPKIWHLRFGPLHVEGGVLKHKEAKAIFAALDRGGSGILSHSDFINGLRKFPRFASRLGLPATIRQGDG